MQRAHSLYIFMHIKVYFHSGLILITCYWWWCLCCVSVLKLMSGFHDHFHHYINQHYVIWQNHDALHTDHLRGVKLLCTSCKIFALNLFLLYLWCVQFMRVSSSLLKEDRSAKVFLWYYIKVTLCNNLTLFEVWFYRQLVLVPSSN